jgi:DNA polymerase-3 subunit delta
VLLFGYDAGLIAERAAAVRRAWTGEDSLALMTFTGKEIKEQPNRLAETLATSALFGGAPLAFIHEAGDSQTAALKPLLSKPWLGDSRVVICAPELRKSSSLLKLFEEASHLVAVPCYADEPGLAAALLKTFFAHDGIRVSSAVLTLLGRTLAGDRLRLRSEAVRLATLAGQGGELTEELVAAALPEVADADEETLLRWLLSDVQAGTTLAEVKPNEMIMRLRLASWLVLRLLSLKMAMEDGLALKTAMQRLAPPVFFRVEGLYIKVLDRWSMPQLQGVLRRLLELERRSKQDSGLSVVLWERFVASV